ncbi:MAG: DUF1674 domain-containing protein [Gammaproteobacteria bacterium]|nr:DUF1674 domain-containing protein [Gammaproteobacteria bacterium]
MIIATDRYQAQVIQSDGGGQGAGTAHQAKGIRVIRNWRVRAHSGTLKRVSEPSPRPNDEREETSGEAALSPVPPKDASAPRRESGGPRGPEPTRFGDWERNGRCIDF